MSVEPRLRTGLWVSAVLRQANSAGFPAFRRRRGDEDAGGVLAILTSRDRKAVVLAQTRAPDGSPAWIRGSGAEPVDEATAEAYVDRQVGRDPDLWVLEFETEDLTPPFEAVLL
ncbi:DUF1491 family protein [Acetobacter sicerae]|uniref:DUF1491 family protein n=1 Tax=Acetobacter sicerae TaxID=85325 RepID=A0ABS8VTP2_9PROT|nr:DUF1491 family protein [Acetobacter sicerae]MCE0742603.1 DUF1491 family protein [Acetobacter sicerae]